MGSFYLHKQPTAGLFPSTLMGAKIFSGKKGTLGSSQRSKDGFRFALLERFPSPSDREGTVDTKATLFSSYLRPCPHCVERRKVKKKQTRSLACCHMNNAEATPCWFSSVTL